MIRDKILKILNERNISTDLVNDSGRNIVDQLELLCNMLDGYQLEVFYKVLGELLILKYEDYPKLIAQVLDKLNKNDFKEKNVLIVGPDSHKKTKTSDLIKIPLLKNYLPNKKNSLKFNKIIDAKITDIDSHKNRLVIIVDDYVGSGEQISKLITDIKPKLNTDDKVICFTLVASSPAINKISELGTPHYYAIHHKRAITENTAFTNRTAATEIMLEIEGKLQKLQPKFSLGYLKTEATISLINTPNNTFPIFWYTKNDWPNIFNRRN